ncbi:MAG: formimidoylglutamase [Bacillaceae bacterium]|nr:formimidoylglutamase [Bacillaceae bacterium]
MKNYGHLYPAGKARFEDRGIIKADTLLKEWNGSQVNGFGLVGVPLSRTSISHSGASAAPDSIRRVLASFSTYAVEEDLELCRQTITDLGDIKMHVTDNGVSRQRIEETLTHLLTDHPRMIPLILGGDHAISRPAISAFSRARGKVGVIQFDAHHDLRNLEDGGPSNGTPFRGLLEDGGLDGRRLVQIGIRNFANGKVYRQYAEEQAITVYTMKEVRARSMTHILEESLETLRSHVEHIYVSVDMDVLDQAFAPGCAAIGPGGMDSFTLFEAVEFLGRQGDVTGLDIVEIDPTRDFRDMTSRTAAFVLLTFLKGKRLAGRGSAS